MRYDTVLETLVWKENVCVQYGASTSVAACSFHSSRSYLLFFSWGGGGVENKMYTCMIVVKSALLHVIQKNGSRSSTRSGIVF